MKILLLIPSRAYREMPGYTKFPDELLLIGAVLEQAGHQVRLHDQNLVYRQPQEFLDFAPDLIGFPVGSGPNIADAGICSTEFKKLLPRVKIAWGFRHPSAFPEQVLTESDADFVIIGPGEITFRELADALQTGRTDLSGIEGLGYKLDGRIVINPERPIAELLDDLPDPAWHLIDIKKYTDITLNVSRGCPYRCTFCSDAVFYQTKQCDLSASRIVSQMERLKNEYGVRHLFISGERFALNHERLQEFCRLVIDKKLKIKWNCPVSGELAEEDITLMARSGCVSVLFEIESGSQRMLDFLQKGNIVEMEKTYWSLLSHHIIPTIFMYYDIPTETVDDFKASIELLDRFDKPPFLYMKFVPYPASELYDYCIDQKLVKEPQSLADWVTFPLLCATDVTLSEVPRKMIADAMAGYRADYAMRRIRFMIRHNPAFFLTALKNPPEFYKALRDLVHYYLDIIFDVANGPKSLLARILRRKSTVKGSPTDSPTPTVSR